MRSVSTVDPTDVTSNAPQKQMFHHCKRITIIKAPCSSLFIKCTMMPATSIPFLVYSPFSMLLMVANVPFITSLVFITTGVDFYDLSLPPRIPKAPPFIDNHCTLCESRLYHVDGNPSCAPHLPNRKRFNSFMRGSSDTVRLPDILGRFYILLFRHFLGGCLDVANAVFFVSSIRSVDSNPSGF